MEGEPTGVGGRSLISSILCSFCALRTCISDDSIFFLSMSRKLEGCMST